MRSIFLFFAVGLLLLIGLNVLSQLPPESHRDADEIRETLARVSGRQAVVLGGSSGIAVDFAGMCLDGVRFYHDAQDLFEVAALGNMILDRPKPPKYFFVVAAPTAQLVDNGSPASNIPQPRRAIYRAMLALGDGRLIDNDWRQAFVAFAAPSLGSGAWRAHFEAAMRAVGIGGRAPTAAELEKIQLTTAESTTNARFEVIGRKDNLRRQHFYDSNIGKRSERGLLELNRRIRERGGTMILIVPPMPDAIRAATVTGLRGEVRDFWTLLRRLSAQGVVIGDYWASPAIVRRLDLFRDNEHLNVAGANFFSRGLAADLRSRGVLPGACTGIARRARQTD